MTLHIDNLLTRTQIGPLTESEIEARGYVRIRRGIYLPADCLPENAARWHVRRIVSEARILSATVNRQGLPPPIFTLESALVVHGLSTWTNTVDVSYRLELNRGRRLARTLAPIHTRDVDVPAVRERQLVSAPSSHKTISINGALTGSLEVVALDCGRFLHPLSAVVAVSSILTHASAFDRRNLSQSREAESKVKLILQDGLTTISGLNGCRQAAAVLGIADAGLQTPGEGYLWWLLHCMLPDETRNHLVTQLPVWLEGRWYYPDAALPERKICFEFDGLGKIKENERDFLSRQRAFLRAGWKPIRVDQRQLDSPDALVYYLLSELRKNGIPAHYPCGPLWQPLTLELLDPRRRF